MSEDAKTEEVKKEIRTLGGFEYFVDRVFDSIDTIVEKVTSGKFISTLLVVFTYCGTISIAGELVKTSRITPETYIALMAGIAALCSTIVKDYFNKEDKKGESS